MTQPPPLPPRAPIPAILLPPTPRPRWRLWITLVLTIALIAFVILQQDRRARAARDLEERQHLSTRYVPLTTADQIANYEYRGFMDPSSYHELRLTPATYAALHAKALTEPTTNLTYNRTAWPSALATAPPWFTIPPTAQILQTEGRTFAFVPTTHTVYIYRWGL